jgi:beta-N-acetylhexosaminidase
VGITVNFGVVADVTANPASFLYPRVLGTSTDEASARVAAAVEGERDSVLSTLKHFPGHGAADGDSHRSIPVSDMPLADWTRTVAPPFAAGIAAGAELVMFGHLAFTAVDPLPASLSRPWHDILEQELGFTGVTITDDLLMLERSGDPAFANRSENAIAALTAGNTMLLYVWPGGDAASGDVYGLIADLHQAVDQGRLSIAQIDENVHQLLMLRRTLSSEDLAQQAPAHEEEETVNTWDFLRKK